MCSTDKEKHKLLSGARTITLIDRYTHTLSRVNCATMNQLPADIPFAKGVPRKAKLEKFFAITKPRRPFPS